MCGGHAPLNTDVSLYPFFKIVLWFVWFSKRWQSYNFTCQCLYSKQRPIICDKPTLYCTLPASLSSQQLVKSSVSTGAVCPNLWVEKILFMIWKGLFNQSLVEVVAFLSILTLHVDDQVSSLDDYPIHDTTLWMWWCSLVGTQRSWAWRVFCLFIISLWNCDPTGRWIE